MTNVQNWVPTKKRKLHKLLYDGLCNWYALACTTLFIAWAYCDGAYGDVNSGASFFALNDDK